MIEVVQEFIISVFCLVSTAAVAAAPVALLAVTIDMLAGGWMAASFRCWLWVVVAIRLLLPCAPGSPVSVQNVWSFPARDYVGQTSVEEAYLDLPAMQSEEVQRVQTTLSEVKVAPGHAASFSQIDWAMVLAVALITTWFVGAAWVLLRAAVASIRFCRKLQAIPGVDDPAIVGAVCRACREIGVTAPVIKRVPGLPAPALFGMRRPTLCLPEGEDLTDSECRMIALHEAMHILRRDGWLAWLLTAVQAAHWCNPIAWLTVRRVERYREQACDAAVHWHTDAGQRGEYARLLMRFATGRPSSIKLGLVGLSFARPAESLTSRISAFTTAEHARRLPRLVSTATVALLVLVGLTDAIGGTDGTTPLPQATPVFGYGDIQAQSLVADDLENLEGTHEANPIEARNYDLTIAVEKADSIPEGADRKQWLLRYAKLGPNHVTPLVQDSKEDANHVIVTMTRKQHELFANVISEVERFGHTYQVVCKMRVFPLGSFERVSGVDWREAVQFTSPQPISSSDWNSASPIEGGKPSVSVEAVSFEFAPFLVFSLKEDDMRKLVGPSSNGQPQPTTLYAPTVTFFSGQTGTIRDQSQRPFVTSVDYIRGESATAAQPNVVVIDEGAEIELSPKMYDDDHVDLRCRLTLSKIDDVRNVKLPGQEVTVQAPKVTRQTVSTICRMKRGESLLIASLGENTLYYAITPHWFPDPVQGANR